MDFKALIAERLESHLLPMGYSRDKIASLLEKPPNPAMGDYSFPCFEIGRELKRNPAEFAAELSQKIKPINGIAAIKAAGPYLNFFVDSKTQSEDVLTAVLKQKNSYGTKPVQKKIRVMIEYSAPNTNKPLHIGHLRNQSIGMSLCRVFEALGYNVIKANFLNDRGIHICKSMLAYQLFGNGKTPKSENQKSDHFVGDYYVRFNTEAKANPSLETQALEMLRLWEKKDPKIRKLWKQMNQWAVTGFQTTYKNFGSEFDHWFKESDLYGQGLDLLKIGLEKKVFEEQEDGSIVCRLEQYGLPDKVILRKDKTSLYITTDLALTREKFDKFKLTSSLWIVATEQNLYFQQQFKILELLGFPWAKNCHHVYYGLVHLPEGRMKSREGKVLDADDLMADLTQTALVEVEKRFSNLTKSEKQKRSRFIALAAIKFFMLKVDTKKDFVFNPTESLSFEGETGPYLLYSYARAKSILSKAGKQTKNPTKSKADFSLLSSENEQALIKLIAEYPQKIEETKASLSPHLMCHYLVSLASRFNSFYHEQPVLAAEMPLRESRIELVRAASIVLSNGMRLLGIEPLEKM